MGTVSCSWFDEMKVITWVFKDIRLGVAGGWNDNEDDEDEQAQGQDYRILALSLRFSELSPR